MLSEEPDDPMPWLAPVGWAMFAVGIVSVCAGQPLLTGLTVIASSVLTGIDLGKREKSGNVIAGWVLGVLLLWLIVWPIYLVKRKSVSEDRAGGVSLARVAVLLVLVLVSIVVFIASAASYTARTGGLPRPAASSAIGNVITGQNVVTLSEFSQLENGMSYETVKNIIGADGVLSAQSQTEGIPGVMPTTVFTNYTWQNPNGSNMSAMFQNDGLNLKAQAGLR
jgi:hypothetical protein